MHNRVIITVLTIANVGERELRGREPLFRLDDRLHARIPTHRFIASSSKIYGGR